MADGIIKLAEDVTGQIAPDIARPPVRDLGAAATAARRKEREKQAAEAEQEVAKLLSKPLWEYKPGAIQVLYTIIVPGVISTNIL